MRPLSGSRLLWILALLLLPVFLLGVLIGPTNVQAAALLEPWLNRGGDALSDWFIVREIRLPRVILSALIGAVLALSGAVLQGLFRNPLADPSLIGVTAGASAGASLSILLSGSLIGGFSLSTWGLGGLSMVTLGAFVGGILAVGLVYQLSTHARGTSVPTMLLVGIAISALAGAMNNFMSFLADNEMLRRMNLWQMGNLDLADWLRVGICTAMLLVFLALLKGQAHKLNALLLGESEARHLGIDVTHMKRRLIFLTALGVGVATALAGTIAFVGLIVPHLVRLLAGPDHRYLLPCSGLMGALLLVMADLVSRTVLSPAELPVGVITAFLGVPFFIYLLRQQREQHV